MKKMTEARLTRMLREEASRRYGEARAKQLMPALRDTAKALWGTRNRDMALEDEPAFFSQSTRMVS